MSIHPIKALDHVLDEYSNYLRTEFRAKDPALRAALERELDAPGFLAQEPFYQAHRPFREGKPWRDLPLEPALAKVIEKRSHHDRAYLHQSDAIETLLSPAACPVVITTGTGSGKTEAFLLPAIQNAFQDSVKFKKSGLTAILVYPMNALSNDQKERIEAYLLEAGLSGAVRVEQYDRSTPQAKREEMRKTPPHILLTNYMMLEYLLVRPADREDIFANHRCRFLVLDEVHTYRGVLGSNIALLVRRLKAHLARAGQDWAMDADPAQRFPKLIPVGTSATIKSLSEEGLSPEETIRQRDLAVQEFFGLLTGAEPESIRVFGEALQEIEIPAEAAYPKKAGQMKASELDVSDPEAVRKALCQLAGVPDSSTLSEAARGCMLLWDLNHWLIKRPMSVSQIVQAVLAEVPDRAGSQEDQVRNEVEACLTVGAALPEGIPGALRLRAHRFIRGGWKFHRCVNPECGKLYPMGEQQCQECGCLTAPLYLCRNCGADYLRFVGDPTSGPLVPSANLSDGPEWLLYVPSRFEQAVVDDDDENVDEEGQEPAKKKGGRTSQAAPAQIRSRPVLPGSIDPTSLLFSLVPEEGNLPVTLSPARTRCLCCGGTAGSRSVITPVALGTSAAVKVLGEGLVEALAEAHAGEPGHDGKERLLIFSDSRQDAAHQARFIQFASRYDRMRRRLMEILKPGQGLNIQRAVELLADMAVKKRDNPHVPRDVDWIPNDRREKVRAWEEAPILDEISVASGYRATLLNLGLVGVSYEGLKGYVLERGKDMAEPLGVKLEDLEHISRAILDEFRQRGALSRQMLMYHPNHMACPETLLAAEWERRVKQPQGFACDDEGHPLPRMNPGVLPAGIIAYNPWHKQGAGGRAPSLERILLHLLSWYGGAEPDEHMMTDLLEFLRRGSFLKAEYLYGFRDKARLLQLNAEVVQLVRLDEQTRFHCGVCGRPMAFGKEGLPCARCHGTVKAWSDAEIDRHRTVQRIRRPEAIPLVAGEHTAQITTEDRIRLEEAFKAGAEESGMNVLACSPTLEMGIDVGGLDAVIMRNVPPRPDNYAQRGGRAGRRSRVGIVVGYARSTPHDQYFYDKPGEMIAGEVPAPVISLGNRDVIVRHLFAIAFGSAQPGLAGRMVDYVGPDGQVKAENLDALIEAVKTTYTETLEVAKTAWAGDVLSKSGLTEDDLRARLEGLPDRIREAVNRTSRQVIELRMSLDNYAKSLEGKRAGVHAADLVARLLGIQTDRQGQQPDADDRSAGYPLRRFAEFGLLPGYEFPAEPASCRLLGDPHEEDPITVARRFGIGQYQPGADVYARSHRWEVFGLDLSSPWNPQSEGATWAYRVCEACELRYDASQPSCPRCKKSAPGRDLPAYEFGGFVAKRKEFPILDEEDRFAVRNLVQVHPQWNGEIAGRWTLPNGWSLCLSRNEEVRWLNEGILPAPGQPDFILHPAAKGYLLCPKCGQILKPPPTAGKSKGRKTPVQSSSADDPVGHSKTCPHRGQNPVPLALTAKGQADVLRILVPVPQANPVEPLQRWGLSLGYALLFGMQHLFMLASEELDFDLEEPWQMEDAGQKHWRMSLAFVDVSIGGSGYLERISREFHRVATRTIDHLDHKDCEKACYRCLKGYRNQRFHDLLEWPLALPALEDLAQEAPQQIPLEKGDLHDPRPWLEAYAAGVGSPLELKFLRLFEKHGFSPEKQVPIAVPEGSAPITVADFAVPEKKLAIYIDGASFHVGENLRRDRYIRDRLRNATPPWRVEELRAKDLSQGEMLAARLKT